MYGFPLDSRAKYTKLDWLLWTAILSETGADFDALFSPAYKFAIRTPDRVPLTDFYDTDTGKHRYFQARSVVGGVLMPMLTDEARGRSGRGDRLRVGGLEYWSQKLGTQSTTFRKQERFSPFLQSSASRFVLDFS